MTSHIIKFTIKGDPIAYLRMTKRQVRLLKAKNPYRLSPDVYKVYERVKRYEDWKEYVRMCALGLKIPSRPTKKIYMKVFIYFRDEKAFKSDIDNITKGIQDALFESDKRVCPCSDYGFDHENPRVEVEIWVTG